MIICSKKYDVLLTPTSPTAPFPIEHPPKVTGGKPLYPLLGIGGYLIPFNMSGHPAMSIPCGKSKEGMPIGIQAVGRYWEEGLLLNLAHRIMG